MKNEFKLKIDKKWIDSVTYWIENSSEADSFIIGRELINAIDDFEMKFKYAELDMVYKSVLSLLAKMKVIPKKTIKPLCIIRDLLYQLIEEAPVYKGYWIFVYTNKYDCDCTNNGVSNRYKELLLMVKIFQK